MSSSTTTPFLKLARAEKAARVVRALPRPSAEDVASESGTGHAAPKSASLNALSGEDPFGSYSNSKVVLRDQVQRTTAPADARRSGTTLRTAAALMALWLILAVHPGTREAFLTSENLSNVTAQIAELVIIGVGMTFVLLTGGIDLSVGAGMALYGTVAATLQIDYHQHAAVAILAALAVSVLVGLWHGFLIAKLRVPPFIATLSGFLAYRGLALLLSNARGLSPMRDDFAFLGGRISPLASTLLCIVGAIIAVAVLVESDRRRRSFSLPAPSLRARSVHAVVLAVIFAGLLWTYRDGMPVPVLLAAIIVWIGGVMLTSSRLGRYAFAIGGNPEAARLSGIPVVRVKVSVYLMTAVLTAVAALISAARTNGVTPGNMGLLRELHVITAVVIGGTSFSGGRATMVGTLLGALIFGTLSNGMNLLNLSSNWQLIINGLILLGASTLDSWSTRNEDR
jgi:D-xylose transport system permease protein